MTRPGFLLFLAILATGACSDGQPVDAPTVYDGYRWGVHAFELTVAGKGDGATLTVRTQDLASRTWSQAVSAPAAEVGGVPAFRFVDAVADFPAHLSSIQAIDWRGAQAVGWPDAETIYVRHKQMRASVAGVDVRASYWALRDGTDPMDLIIGEDNTVIAAIDVRNDTVLVRRGYEALTTVGRWRDPDLSQPLYGYKALDLQMMPTRAGPRLATRVYLPDGDIEGPFPTILVRNPYGISDLIEEYQHYALRGYAVVLQAARGTIHWDPDSLSEGAPWDMMVQEPADGADALDWVVAQPWSDGFICMQGLSYHGYTQWAATMARNPALKCIVPKSSMGTAFSDQPYMGGTMVQGLVTYYTFRMLNKPLLPGRTWSEVLRHRPLKDIDVYATGEDLPVYNRFFEHWRNDAFWQAQDWYQGDHDRDFSALQISGWFDDDYPGTRSNWALMARHGTGANRLILGPWRHSFNRDRSLNGYSFGADAMRDDIWLLKQKWYDYHLKGVRNDVADTVVEYFVLGENRWRTSDAWPPREAMQQAWYFHSNGGAHRYSDDGALSRQPPSGPQPADTYVYDPADPVENWYSFDLMERWADYQSYPYDFKDIESRDDVVTYTSEPLERDTTIAGDIKVVLYASTDVKDTDWWAYLADVSPDNASHRLSVGVLRARFRNLEDPDYHVFGSNFEHEELLSGDMADVVRYEISIPSVANTFKKGHRLRVAIMNAHDNYSFPNSNTGGDEGAVTHTVTGTMRVHHTPAAPSHIILPVLAAPAE